MQKKHTPNYKKTTGIRDNYIVALNIHDILCRNIRYVENLKENSHSIELPLCEKEGVCEGIAKAYQCVLGELQIPCILVVGLLKKDKKNSEKHAWNLVRVEQEWMHVDVTGDLKDEAGTVAYHDYFGLSDYEIMEDHFFNKDDYPKAKSASLGYYARVGLTIRTTKQLEEYIRNGIKKGEDKFDVKIVSARNTDYLLPIAERIIRQCLMGQHKYSGYQISFRDERKTFQIDILRENK